LVRAITARWSCAAEKIICAVPDRLRRLWRPAARCRGGAVITRVSGAAVVN
jgi:hypothetical protein